MQAQTHEHCEDQSWTGNEVLSPLVAYLSNTRKFPRNVDFAIQPRKDLATVVSVTVKRGTPRTEKQEAGFSCGSSITFGVTSNKTEMSMIIARLWE